MFFRFYTSCLAAIFMLLPAALSAEVEVVHIDRHNEKIVIGRNCEVLEDKSGLLKVEDVIYRQDFTRPANEIPNYGFTRSVYWVRFSVLNESAEALGRFIEVGFPLLDQVSLYAFTEKGRRLELKRIEVTGRAFPFSTRVFEHRNFIFPVDIYAKEKVNFLFRIKTDDGMIFPISLWKAASLNSKIQTEQFLFGIYYGIIIVMILYNLFIFLSTGDRNYFNYILYISSFGMFQMAMNGIAFQYLWPGNSWWAIHANPFFIGLSSMTAAYFSVNFLETSENTPVIDKILKTLIILGLILTVASVTADYSITIIAGQLLPLIMILIAIPAAVICYRRGNMAARFYLIAWTVFFAGVILSILRITGLIGHNVITEHGLQIGSAIEMILLSLALADRINIMKAEKEQAQEAVITQQREMVHQLNLSKKQIEEAHSLLGLSEEKYRKLVEGSGDIIFSLDSDWNFINANNAIRNELRLDPSKISSMNFMDIVFSGKEEMGVSRNLILEKLQKFSDEKKPVQFRAPLVSPISTEPRDMLISLEYVTTDGGDEILGKASSILDDSLLLYFHSENQTYFIGNLLTTAEDITHRITRNLTKFISKGEINLIRIALRETILNAIEHGNLGISFEDKSRAIENESYFSLIREKQSLPENEEKKIRIEYSVSSTGVEYRITDQGEGFDHSEFIKNISSKANEDMLSHGRGITMTCTAFDEVCYNEKGNSVKLVKKFITESEK